MLEIEARQSHRREGREKQMRKLMILGLILAAFTVSAGAATWNFDNSHTTIGFKVRHMVISKVTGHFSDFEGKIENFDGKDFGAASVQVTIQTSSIDTDDEDRDKHLQSGDFLMADSFPTMTFVSKSVSEAKGDGFEIVGDLTLRGVTRTVTLVAEFHGVVDDPWGNTRTGFSASTSISREAFGTTFNKALETGGLVVGDEVEIVLEVEAVKAK
jgi:polyisoprenoid-binding protein YceI